MDFNPHIVNGHGAYIEEYPFMVSLRIFGNHMCGGSIYTRKLVLTAAHCIEKFPHLMKVVAGSTYLNEPGQEREIFKAHIHLDYSQLGDHDLGIIELRIPFRFDEFVQPIALVKKRPPPRSKVATLGWGTTAHNVQKNKNHLQVVFLKVIDRDTCQRGYDAVQTDLISQYIICAGVDDFSKDACQNDSGGPLVFKGQLLGIVSFGMGCAQEGYYGIYTSIPDHYDWIMEKAAEINQRKVRLSLESVNNI